MLGLGESGVAERRSGAGRERLRRGRLGRSPLAPVVVSGLRGPPVPGSAPPGTRVSHKGPGVREGAALPAYMGLLNPPWSGPLLCKTRGSVQYHMFSEGFSFKIYIREYDYALFL